MLVNHGEEEFGEGLKARKMVTTIKRNTNPYAIETVLLGLNNEKWLLKSEMKFPPPTPMGAYFVISAIRAVKLRRFHLQF